MITDRHRQKTHVTKADIAIDNPSNQQDRSVDDLCQAVAAQLRALDARPLDPGLYLVATPIGNLSDVTLRALHTLARADMVYCEDTRQTRKLTERFALRPTLRAYHDHSGDQARTQMIAELSEGKTLALVSDAGTPLISDPGHKLVRAARAADIAVYAIPGPSAALAALVGSGQETDRFYFEGFLPNKAAARRDRLGKLMEIPGALVVYEAPGRLAATLADLADVLPGRSATVARELTKLHEESRAGSLTELAAHFADATVRGEIVIVVGPPPRIADISDAAITEALTGLLDTMSLRDASRELADHFGISRKRIYDIGLAFRTDESDG